MAEPGASRTAVGAAVLRAVHQFLDGSPRVLDDPIVLRLLDAVTMDSIRERAPLFRTPRAMALRAHVLLRSRYAEDQLRLAAGRGIEQYLILGAGFDTFAYRQPPWAQALRIFEVDHPLSQQAKRDRLGAADVPIPSNLTFAAIDFARQSLADGLAAHGFDAARPAFLSCLGVLVYLPHGAVTEIFQFVARLPPGSECVFTFGGGTNGSDPGNQDSRRASAPRLRDMAAAIGEPWQSSLDLDETRALLGSLGLDDLSVLTAERAAEYIGSRDDGLAVPRRERIASIKVGRRGAAAPAAGSYTCCPTATAHGTRHGPRT